jgi:hypothetical protein
MASAMEFDNIEAPVTLKVSPDVPDKLDNG